MTKIIAKYLSDYDSEKRDGSGRVFCPFCHDAAQERDIEEYAEEGTSRALEMCTNCREGFERDLGLAFESDTLSKAVFGQLLDELPTQDEEEHGLNEKTAEQIAKALGGEAWQSGGGIWLVLIRRKDGCLVVISDDVVGEYASEADFDAGKAERTVLLT